MTILFIGDPHLKITRFDLAVQFLKWATEVAVRLKPDAVVNLGDTFDTHAVVRSELQQEFREHVEGITSSNIKYYYILGNHDFYKPTSGKYHALQAFKGFDSNFIVVDKRLDFDNITMVPHIPNFRDFPLNTREICIAHQTFIGADYGYIRPDVGVDADDVKAEIIVSGHIHMRQEFGKVIYPGTPYSQSADDIDQIKGLLLFDTETYKRKFIQSPLPMWRGLRFELDPTQELIGQVHQQIAQSINKKDHWTIEITGPKAEIIAYRDSKEYAALVDGCDVKFTPHFVDNEKRMVKIEAVSMEQIVGEWANKVYQGTVDKGTVVSKATEILNKVRQANTRAKL